MIVIPHVRQSDRKQNCGAACLAMIYHSHRVKGKLDEITDRVSVEMPNGIRSCRNNRMADDAISNGFCAACVTYKSLFEFSNACLDNNINLILSFHPSDDDPRGHFAVLTGCEQDVIYLNDPGKDLSAGTNVKKEIAWLESHSKVDRRVLEIVKDNTAIVLQYKKISELISQKFCERCGQPIIYPTALSGKMNSIYCLKCGTWNDF